MAVKATTAPERAYMRLDGQWSKLYLDIYNPPTIFSRRLDGTPASLDQVVELPYTGTGTGVFADVLIDMTLWVGSTAGAYDKGQCRIRAAADGSKLYIGETSDIAFASGDYLTVVDEFCIWARHMRRVGTTPYADWSIPYGNQHAVCDPVPVLGPDAVAWLDTNGTVDVAFDGSSSFVPLSTITGWQWYAPGSAALVDDTTATPTMTYNVAGTYRVYCVLTAGLGATYTGYRLVFVHDAANLPITQFKLDSCSGSHDAGGYTFKVTLYAEADSTAVRDRALVILHATDYYGNAQISLGPIPGRENIICAGWILGESIVRNPELSTVSFEVAGPQAWLSKIAGFPCELFDTLAAPAAWTEFEGLTVDNALWHFVIWRSTLARCCDTILTGDTRGVADVAAPLATLWQQLQSIADITIMASPCCDRYAALGFEIDAQLLSSRAAIVEVMTLLGQDWRGSLDIQRQPLANICLEDVSGTAYSAGVQTPIGARSPGESPKHYGSPGRHANLALVDNAGTLSLAGLLAGWQNNEYPNISVPLAANNRFFDIFPSQYAIVSLTAAQTPRGITWTSKRFLVRGVSYELQDGGMLLPTLQLEGETFAENSVLYTTPPTDLLSDVTPAPAPPAPPIMPGKKTIAQVILVDDNIGPVWCTGAEFATSAPAWRRLGSGISAPDLIGWRLAVDRSNGARIWGTNGSNLWSLSAAFTGSPAWTLLHDAAWVQTQVPGTGAGVFQAIAADPLAPNHILLGAGRSGVRSDPEPIWLFYSVDGGQTLVKGARVARDTDHETNCMAITFGVAKAAVSYMADIAGTGQHFHYSRIAETLDGGITLPHGTHIDLDDGPGGPVTHCYHCRGGVNDKLIIWHNEFGAMLDISADDGHTVLSEVQNVAPYAFAAALDKNGGRAMAIEPGSTTMVGSLTSGATWAAVTPPVGPDVKAVVNTGVAVTDWVVAGLGVSGPAVFFTQDFGASWVNKSGNLAALTGAAPDITQIEVLLYG